MWTPTLTVVLLAASYCQASNDASPTDPQSINQRLICMVPGEAAQQGVGKRSVPSDQPPVPEPLLVLSLQPAGASDAWNLPNIGVKAPYGNPNTDLLDFYLQATAAMNMVTAKTQPTSPPPDPNAVFGEIVLPLPVPYLEGLSADEQDVINNYVSAAGVGQCPANFVFIRRPEFYYPPFQAQAVCSGDDCGLPSSDQHEFGQFCRPNFNSTTLIGIRALRWDCCFSWTADQKWEYVCGWRTVVVHIISQCECSCDGIGRL